MLTLALTANLNANVFTLAREVGVPVVQHLVGNDLSPQLLELARAGLLRSGDEYIHCLGINDAGLAGDQGHRRTCLNLHPDRYGDGPWVAAIQEALDHGFRPSLSSDHGVAIAQDFLA